MIRLPKGSFLTDPASGYHVRVGPDDLILPRGSLLVLIGPSGAGKSVLCEVLLVALHGKQVWTKSGSEQRTCQYVSQDKSLFPDCSLRMNAILRSGMNSRDRVLSLLPVHFRTHIEDRWGRSPRGLSGGQARSFAIASSLASKPDALILDESLASMDTGVRAWMLGQIREKLAAGEIGIAIITSHERDVAASADAVWRLWREGTEYVVGNGERPRVSEEADPSIALQRAPEASEWRPVPRVPLRGWQMLIASGMACLVTIGLLYGAASSTEGGRRYFVPGVGELIVAVKDRGWNLLLTFAEAWALAALSLLAAAVLALAVVFVVLPRPGWLMRWAVLTLIALQGIPTLVLARTLRTQLGLGTVSIILWIAASFVLFPLSAAWMRLGVATPECLLRARGVPRAPGRALLSCMWASGSMVRVFVACSPLSAIGVVVAGYLAGESGLGYDLFNSISNNNGSIADRWVLTVTCSLLSCAILLTAALLATIVLPRDVDHV